MGRKLFRILRHAVTMVRRNLRSYSMLSVTIVISFSLLLGFLTLMDSNHYSDYKERFAKDRSIVYVSNSRISQGMAEIMQEKASIYGTTYSTQILQSSMYLVLNDLALETGEELLFEQWVTAYSLPRQSWFFQVGDDPIPVTWLDGKEHPNYDLKSGEILLDEQIYYALGMEDGDRTIELELWNGFSGDLEANVILTKEFTVVGTVHSDWVLNVKMEHDEIKDEDYATIEHIESTPYVVFSLEDVNPYLFSDRTWHRTVAFYTDAPESVKKMIETMDPSLYVHAVYESQNQALEKIQTEKGTKAMVAMILLLLLGINLYSSFDNALNNRKFEIGVKRALGASAFSIVRQFFYEGLLVMIVDILLSVAIVTDVAIAYKFIKESIPDEFGNFEHYVLYISPYSVAIFIICALVLTVVFSFVFAYKSTQVQIVDYLKAE